MILRPALFTGTTLRPLSKDVGSIVNICMRLLLTAIRNRKLLLWIASTLGFRFLVLARLLDL